VGVLQCSQRLNAGELSWTFLQLHSVQLYGVICPIYPKLSHCVAYVILMKINSYLISRTRNVSIVNEEFYLTECNRVWSVENETKFSRDVPSSSSGLKSKPSNPPLPPARSRQPTNVFTFNGLNAFISQKTELSVTSAVRTYASVLECRLC
jgi:hypothetical protein